MEEQTLETKNVTAVKLFFVEPSKVRKSRTCILDVRDELEKRRFSARLFEAGNGYVLELANPDEHVDAEQFMYAHGFNLQPIGKPVPMAAAG